jgi:hypothetical protein
MPKRPAPAIPANYNFARAYFELKKLREDVECFERLSGLSSGQAAEANVDEVNPDTANYPRVGSQTNPNLFE